MTIDITTRNLLIGLCSHINYMQGQLEALHQLDDPDDYYWFRESVALRQKVADHLAAMADRPAVPAPTVMEIIELSEEAEAAGLGQVDFARAVLARWGNPAPQPAAVTGRPSDEEWDALVERVWDKYQTVGYQGERFMYDGDFSSALDLVRKELSRWGHQPAPPADGEVAELVAEIRHFLAGYQQMRGLDPEHIYSIHRGDKMEAHITVSRLTRAADLLERQVLPEVGE